MNRHDLKKMRAACLVVLLLLSGRGARPGELGLSRRG